MEQFIAVEIFIALLAASCITGWLIGDWNGSERVRKLIGTDHDAAFDDWEPLCVDYERGDHQSVIAATIGAARQAAKQSTGAAMSKDQGAPVRSHQRPAQDALALTEATGSEMIDRVVDGARAADCEKPLSNREASDVGSSLAALHAQAKVIRQTSQVWDPIELGLDLGAAEGASLEVLNHYQGAIDGLRRTSEDDLDQSQFDWELPRFADAASAPPLQSDASN